MSENAVYVVYGYDRYYPPSYGVIAVCKTRKNAEQLTDRLRKQDGEKIQEGDTRFPESVRGGYAGLYECIAIEKEPLLVEEWL